jgi:hypothetical protein
MKIFLLTFFLSFQALACWKMEGRLSFNGKDIKINQKIKHDETYSFQKEKLIFNIKMPSKFDKPQQLTGNIQAVDFEIFEKENLKLQKVSHGKVLVKENRPAVMTTTDNNSGHKTVFEIKLTHI